MEDPPKPACILYFEKTLGPRPFGRIPMPYEVYADWCGPANPGCGVGQCKAAGSDFSLFFGRVNWEGGCNLDPDALLGLYGFLPQTIWDKAEAPPCVLRALSNTMGGGNTPFMCHDGATVGPLPGALGVPPDVFPLYDAGQVPVLDISDSFPPVQWIACYPSGAKCRFRVYEFRARAASCGSEFQLMSVASSPAIAADLSNVEDAGSEQNGALWNGALLESMTDPNEPAPPDPNDPNTPVIGRPFPDPDFPPYDPNNIGGGTLDPNFAVSPPYSLRIVGNAYIARPRIPDRVVQARQLRFWHRCPIRAVQMLARTGQFLQFDPNGLFYFSDPNGIAPPIDPNFPFFDPNTYDPNAFNPGWPCDSMREIALNIPPSFDLEAFAIVMDSGWIDDIRIEFAPPVDCNGNGINDYDDIERGRSMDNNGNSVPDECDPRPCGGDPDCFTDVDGDCIISSVELQCVLDEWAVFNPSGYDCDFNDDGDVGNTDLQAVLDAWQNNCR
jgi:hypothetical protein